MLSKFDVVGAPASRVRHSNGSRECVVHECAPVGQERRVIHGCLGIACPCNSPWHHYSVLVCCSIACAFSAALSAAGSEMLI